MLTETQLQTPAIALRSSGITLGKSIMALVKPFLRWAGSKRKQISRLRQFWRDDHLRYVEPFAGSACLFFAIQPARAVLADKNSQLIETYEVVRRDPGEVYDRVVALPRTKSVYYAQRSRDPRRLSTIGRAARFVYLNRNCFNGIYRTNTQGLFNVPFATSRAGAFVSREEFIAAARALTMWNARLGFWTNTPLCSEGRFCLHGPALCRSCSPGLQGIWIEALFLL